MPSSDSPQGIYAPLSQAMSDSDSEEEIHNSTGSGQKTNSKLAQQYFFNFENLNNQNNYHKTNGTMTQNRQDGGSLGSFNSEMDIQNTADDVAILGTKQKTITSDEPMSPLRKLCFIGSICFCFFTVAVFLWVVPCSDGGSVCPAPVDRVKTHNWLNNYTSLELKGEINVVDGVRGWEKNLLFLYRGDAFFPEFAQNNNNCKKNGIISIIGSSGAVSWFDYRNNEPLSMDCTLIDVDKNGKTDCLIIDEYGEMGMINPISGQWWWKFQPMGIHQKIDTLDLPIILPDLDNDHVYEILIATTHESHRNFIRILSGRTGRPLGDGFKIHDCLKIRKLQLDGSVINFICVKNTTDVQKSKTISEFFSLVTNKSIGQKSTTPAPPQFRLYGQRKEIKHQSNIYSLNGRELFIENNGKCPENCNMTFILTEKRDGKPVLIKNFTEHRMYGMVPKQWHFKNDKSDISGFVIKFWKWENDATNGTNQQNDTTTRHKRSNTDYEYFAPEAGEFNVFDHLIQKRNTYTMPPATSGGADVHVSQTRVERSIANITKQKSGTNNYKMQIIKETVFIIIFNGGHTDFENTSQSNIIQFCRNTSDDIICQPDLNNQENSLLIADLDQDGSQELVSYYTTFVNKNEDKKDWKLVTYVNLIRLQADLPTLFEMKGTTNYN